MLSGGSAFTPSRDAREGFKHGIYALDILPLSTLTHDGGTIFASPYKIRLTVKLTLFEELFNETWFAAQTNLENVEAELEGILREIKLWKTRLKAAEEEGFVVTQNWSGMGWQFHFKNDETYATEEEAWKRGRNLLRLLFGSRRSRPSSRI